ncbi:hypothetical protein FF124_05710 [Martelella lutilitoris]|uniref:Protein phosphatase 2C domain-containing protein n=1 Tax=Martelella lutilitoris TaxID=2583532 RepID=A0A5C4JVF0_9HYPH|nr:hypothetical protein [Martelella lutilitoris]TNB48629.1 hypothetical protein FF124_05710 [Martelella lutilitoris]
MRIEIVDRLNDPGKPGGHSEDRAGANEHSAFVIDGATGIADRQVMTDFPSDAAWLADRAAAAFSRAGSPESVADIVSRLNAEARAAYLAAAGTGDLPRYMWPAAAFQMLRIEGDRLVSYGLGDCRLFLQSEVNGRVFETTALKGNRTREIAAARAHLARTGGFGGKNDIGGDEKTRAALRESRSKHNMPGGRIFTLGLVPEAADAIVREETGIAAPARGLLSSDGFAALSDNYDAFSPSGLIDAAFDEGLPVLLKRLREIERIEDPEGERFPRYKVSDDATCLAFRIF